MWMVFWVEVMISVPRSNTPCFTECCKNPTASENPVDIFSNPASTHHCCCRAYQDRFPHSSASACVADVPTNPSSKAQRNPTTSLLPPRTFQQRCTTFQLLAASAAAAAAAGVAASMSQWRRSQARQAWLPAAPQQALSQPVVPAGGASRRPRGLRLPHSCDRSRHSRVYRLAASCCAGSGAPERRCSTPPRSRSSRPASAACDSTAARISSSTWRTRVSGFVCPLRLAFWVNRARALRSGRISLDQLHKTHS